MSRWVSWRYSSFDKQGLKEKHSFQYSCYLWCYCLRTHGRISCANTVRVLVVVLIGLGRPNIDFFFERGNSAKATARVLYFMSFPAPPLVTGLVHIACDLDEGATVTTFSFKLKEKWRV